jgi:hypothetical protein
MCVCKVKVNKGGAHAHLPALAQSAMVDDDAPSDGVFECLSLHINALINIQETNQAYTRPF